VLACLAIEGCLIVRGFGLPRRLWIRQARGMCRALPPTFEEEVVAIMVNSGSKVLFVRIDRSALVWCDASLRCRDGRTSYRLLLLLRLARVQHPGNPSMLFCTFSGVLCVCMCMAAQLESSIHGSFEPRDWRGLPVAQVKDASQASPPPLTA